MLIDSAPYSLTGSWSHWKPCNRFLYNPYFINAQTSVKHQNSLQDIRVSYLCHHNLFSPQCYLSFDWWRWSDISLLLKNIILIPPAEVFPMLDIKYMKSSLSNYRVAVVFELIRISESWRNITFNAWMGWWSLIATELNYFCYRIRVICVREIKLLVWNRLKKLICWDYFSYLTGNKFNSNWNS